MLYHISSNLSRLRLLTVVALSTLSTLVIPLTASAAPTAAQAINSTPTTLKISPLRTDLTVTAGGTGTVTVTAFNTTSSAIVLKAIENDFVAGDETGKPAIILDQNSYAPTHSLKRFMVALPNVTVPPNSSTDVKLTIQVPKSAQAGGYFGALRFAPATSDGSKQVNLGASVVSLILLTVPGPTVEKLSLTNFDVQQNGGTASNFRTPNDLNLFLRFENKGNLQEAPFGQVYVKKGNKVTYKADFNDKNPKDQILPDSARRWTIPIKGMSKFGKYTVGATFGYGASSQNIEITKTVWIVPTTYILIIVGSVVALVAIVAVLYIFLKSYKRKILRSSRRRY